MNANPELSSIVSTFTSSIEALIREEAKRSIEAAFAGLSNGASTAGVSAPARKAKAVAAPKAKTPRKGKKTRTKTDPAALAATVAKLLAFVKKNPGSRSEDVRAGLGLEKPAYQKAVAAAVAAKQLIKKGEKRATTLTAKAGK